MSANTIKCPKCGSSTIYSIPSHREPVSLFYVLSLGWWLYLILPALPSKFRCDSCRHIFRRYTGIGWLYLTLLAVVVLIFAVPWLVYLVRYALWAGSN